MTKYAEEVNDIGNLVVSRESGQRKRIRFEKLSGRELSTKKS